jgi:hypothetical protein
MINPIIIKNGIKAEQILSGLKKSSFAIIVSIVALQSAHAESLQSPKGAEVFQAAIVVPPQKTIRISWSYPANWETPDLIFKVYHSPDLHVAIRQWALLTNIPGSVRNADLPANQTQGFFVMTASNYLGESSFATR